MNMGCIEGALQSAIEEISDKDTNSSKSFVESDCFALPSKTRRASADGRDRNERNTTERTQSTPLPPPIGTRLTEQKTKKNFNLERTFLFSASAGRRLSCAGELLAARYSG